MEFKTMKQAVDYAKMQTIVTHKEHLAVKTFINDIKYINNQWIDIHIPYYTVILNN